MQVIDNCPVCHTMCELKYGIATCETCKTRWRRRIDPKAPGRMIFEKWACRIPEMNVPIPLIGGNIKLGSRLCRWTKVKERQLHVDAPKLRTEATISKGEVIEETIAVRHKEPAFYDFRLRRGDRVEGNLTSNEPLDIGFMDDSNFNEYMNGKRHPIVEDANVGIYETRISFKAPRKGLWWVVMENPSKTSAKVEIRLHSLLKKRRK